MINEAGSIEVAGPQVSYLTYRAGHRVLMTFGAGLSVVDRPEPISNGHTSFEYLSITIELFLAFEAVGQSVEASRRFKWNLYLRGASQRKQHGKRHPETGES